MGASFECSLCGYRREFKDAIRLYDTSDEIPVIDWPCWCWQCDDISLAEYIPSSTEILEEARAWKRRDREHKYKMYLGPIDWRDDEREQGALEHYDAVFTWRRVDRRAAVCSVHRQCYLLLLGKTLSTPDGDDRVPSLDRGGILECRCRILDRWR